MNQESIQAESKQAQDTFLIDEEDRYSRLKLIGWWDQRKLAAAHVLVVGAGALGNEVLKNLALVGIGEITLIDFDTIQHSNLSRSVLFRADDADQPKAIVAANVVREMNPDCRINEMVGDVMADIGLGLVKDCDVVICCVDNREARLWINRMCWKVATPWIDGGIQEINGVAKVFMPPDGACYECAMTERDYQLIQLRYSCPLLKLEEMQQGKVPTAPTIASIIGGLQTQEALKLIHGLATDEGSAMVFNGVANQFYKTKYPYRDECLSHEFYDPIVDLPLSADATVDQLFAAVNEHADVESESLELDRDFLMRLECSSCDVKKEINQPRSTVDMKQAICTQCEQVMTPITVSEVRPEDGGDRKMSEFGIPPYDIVKVHANNDVVHVLLAADGKKSD